MARLCSHGRALWVIFRACVLVCVAESVLVAADSDPAERQDCWAIESAINAHNSDMMTKQGNIYNRLVDIMFSADDIEAALEVGIPGQLTDIKNAVDCGIAAQTVDLLVPLTSIDCSLDDQTMQLADLIDLTNDELDELVDQTGSLASLIDITNDQLGELVNISEYTYYNMIDVVGYLHLLEDILFEAGGLRASQENTEDAVIWNEKGVAQINYEGLFWDNGTAYLETLQGVVQGGGDVEMPNVAHGWGTQGGPVWDNLTVGELDNIAIGGLTGKAVSDLGWDGSFTVDEPLSSQERLNPFSGLELPFMGELGGDGSVPLDWTIFVGSIGILMSGFLVWVGVGTFGLIFGEFKK